jgi:hypothetical protein
MLSRVPTNFRPLAIFTFYMTLALTLTVTIIQTIIKRRKVNASKLSPSQITKLRVFSFLAILSLGTTWYYMFQFFVVSYKSWASTFPAVVSGELRGLQLGLWLKDSKLFEEAWGTACATPIRYWWTQQIFLWTTIWSLGLGKTGTFLFLLSINSSVESKIDSL